jgi:hypothetical protein
MKTLVIKVTNLQLELILTVEFFRGTDKGITFKEVDDTRIIFIPFTRIEHFSVI